jgi:hypothetical protein
LEADSSKSLLHKFLFESSPRAHMYLKSFQ